MCSMILKSASPPTGTSSSTTLERLSKISRTRSSAALFALSALFTFSASVFELSKSAGRSSFAAAPTAFDKVFCSARSASNSLMALRLASSAAITLSTRVGSSPRALCDERTRSGFSRRNLRSITCSAYLLQPASRKTHLAWALQIDHHS